MTPSAPSNSSNGSAPGQPAAPPNAPPSMWSPTRRPNFWVSFLVLLALNYLIVTLFFPDTPNLVTVSYTFFKQQVEAGNVLEITARGEDIQGVFKQPVSAPDSPAVAATVVAGGPTPTAAAGGLFGLGQPGVTPTFTRFATVKPTLITDPDLIKLLETNKVVITARPLESGRSVLGTLLLTFGPTILLIAGFLYLNRRMAQGGGLGGSGGIFGLGNSRAKRYDAATTEQKVDFGDVAGIDEVEAELVEVVDFLKHPEKYRKLGGKIPKGVLLVGAPGTGKTLLARAVAGEAHVPFFSLSGSEFIEMVVGVGAARVRDLFKQAREAAPSIIFIDELDAIGRARGSNQLGGDSEREQTLNQILVEMDGFGAGTTVIVLAATNRADVLDQALLRPGRFDRRVTVQPPDRNGRTEILRIHSRDVPLADDVKLEKIAEVMPGATGAELRNLVNEAALLAARRSHEKVNARDFSDAMEKIILGTERRILMRPEDRERVAYHEAGHALCGLLQAESDPVRSVTIVPRSQALGVTLSVPADDRLNYTEGYIRGRIVTAFGGRAAEQVVYSTITTGAENDLKQVTNLAQAMVTRFGMDPEVGQVQYVSSEEGNFIGATATRPYSEETARAIDRAVRQISETSYSQAIALLTTHRTALDALAHALLERETLNEAEILEIAGVSAPAPAIPLA